MDGDECEWNSAACSHGLSCEPLQNKLSSRTQSFQIGITNRADISTYLQPKFAIRECL